MHGSDAGEQEGAEISEAHSAVSFHGPSVPVPFWKSADDGHRCHGREDAAVNGRFYAGYRQKPAGSSDRQHGHEEEKPDVCRVLRLYGIRCSASGRRYAESGIFRTSGLCGKAGVVHRKTDALFPDQGRGRMPAGKAPGNGPDLRAALSGSSWHGGD